MLAAMVNLRIIQFVIIKYFNYLFMSSKSYSFVIFFKLQPHQMEKW